MRGRLEIFLLRFLDYFTGIPLRIFRMLKCVCGMQPFPGKNKFLRWLAASILMILDITPVGFITETIMGLTKRQARSLNAHEVKLASWIFHQSLPLKLICMDPASQWARKKLTVAYTVMHTIHFDKVIADETYIHELVHIWQYRKYGAVYVSESIWAQRWGGGYNYGGIEALKANIGKGLQAFNFEQQAEIIEDFFRLKNGRPLQWVAANVEIPALLEAYMHNINNEKAFT